MIDHPRVTRAETGEPALAITLEPPENHDFVEPSRRTFFLSTRAIGLLVDDLGYTEREELAPITTKALLCTGGASVPDEEIDAADIVRRLRCPAGGKHPTDREIERVAAYLKDAEIEQRLLWLTEELLEDDRLSAAINPEEITTRRGRTNGLREIAKDL